MKKDKNKKVEIFRIVLFVLVGLCGSIAGAEEIANSKSNPWEKFSLDLGFFTSKTNTTATIGSGIGMEINLQDVLGMNSNESVFRLDSFWRFSENRKHRLDLSWFSFRQTAQKNITEDFQIENGNGDTITFPSGTNVSSHFNLNIVNTAYSYSFFQDDRLDLAALGGLYVMPISFGVSANGGSGQSGSFNFTAPLPVAGVRMDVAITPKWFFRTTTQVFYVEYQNYTGHLAEVRGALEYLPAKHVGVGLGYDSMQMGLASAGKTIEGYNLDGSVNFNYTGLMMYLKMYY